MQECRKIVGKAGDPLPGQFPAQQATLDVENYIYEQLTNGAGAVHDEVCRERIIAFEAAAAAAPVVVPIEDEGPVVPTIGENLPTVPEVRPCMRFVGGGGVVGADGRRDCSCWSAGAAVFVCVEIHAVALAWQPHRLGQHADGQHGLASVCCRQGRCAAPRGQQGRCTVASCRQGRRGVQVRGLTLDEDMRLEDVVEDGAKAARVHLERARIVSEQVAANAAVQARRLAKNTVEGIFVRPPSG